MLGEGGRGGDGSEEERELFPAVLASATAGEERDRVKSIVDALTAEHRKVEAAWSRLEPKLKALGLKTWITVE